MKTLRASREAMFSTRVLRSAPVLLSQLGRALLARLTRLGPCEKWLATW